MQSGKKVDIMLIQKIKSNFQSERDRMYNVEKYRLKGRAAKLYLNGVKLSVAKETSFTAIKDLTANEK